MPPQAPGRGARQALQQPAEQMPPGSEPISARRAGAPAGRESRGSPACQGRADSCQGAKAPGSPSLPAIPHLEGAVRPPRSSAGPFSRRRRLWGPRGPLHRS